jgi:peptidoglycan/LPS O-acetylase OafA/YrhL
MRGVAALLVLIIHATGHLNLFRVQIGPLAIHHDAVIVFFVLSGFVVAYAALERDLSGSTFTINRFARIASVAIPAIVLTIAVDTWFTGVASAEPDFAYQLDNMSWYIGICLTMSGSFWSAETACFSNGPYWSLTFEVWFYVVFGIAAFAPTLRVKVIGVAAALAIMGPKLVLLLPCWLLGVLAYWLLKRQYFSVSQTTAWMLMLVPIGAYIALKQVDLIRFMWINVVGPIQLATGYDFHVAATFPYDWILAGMVAVNIFGAAQALEHAKPRRFIRAITSYIAGISFSLYLYHSPLLLLFGASLPAEIQGWTRAIIIILPTLVGCALIAQVTEYRKEDLRLAVRRVVLTARSIALLSRPDW